MTGLMFLPVLKRPETRGECADVPRPCPFSSQCRYGLNRDDREGTRGYKGLRFEREQRQRAENGVAHESCALDIAERGPRDRVEIARLMGVTKQAVEKIEQRAMIKVERRGFRLKGAWLR